MSYEEYLQEKETIVYMLRDLKIHNRFILNEDSELLHVGWQMKEEITLYKWLKGAQNISLQV